MNINKLCEHLKNDGTPCKSPALRHGHFCFTHNRVHNGLQIDANHSCRMIPNLKTARDIRVAATTILRDLRDGRIDGQRARLMAYILQLANANLKQRDKLTSKQATMVSS